MAVVAQVGFEKASDEGPEAGIEDRREDFDAPVMRSALPMYRLPSPLLPNQKAR